MKKRSDIKPSDVIIELNGDKVMARFAENIMESNGGSGETYFECDEYIFFN